MNLFPINDRVSVLRRVSEKFGPGPAKKVVRTHLLLRNTGVSTGLSDGFVSCIKKCCISVYR